VLILVSKAFNSLLVNNGKQWRTNETLQRFYHYYYGIISHLKIKSDFKTLRVALSSLYINSRKRATLPDSGWRVAFVLL